MPVPMGSGSSFCPGTHTVSQPVLRNGLPEPMPGRADSPKHVHPLPCWSASWARLAIEGGTSDKMAWWTSGLLGKNCDDTMNCPWVMWGSSRVQW